MKLDTEIEYDENLSVPDILMVDPEFFRVDYEINPHMDKDVDVDSEDAKSQHEDLIDIYEEELGLDVHLVDVEQIPEDDFPDVEGGAEEYPDMVFAANHGFTYEESGEVKVLPSNMANKERKGEVAPVMDELEDLGAEVLSPTESTFEGSGDAMEHPEDGAIWVGYGQRTEEDAVEEIADRTGLETRGVKLETEDFYHLDTCFEHLDEETALIHSDAIADEDVEKITDTYERVIEVEDNENYDPESEAYKMASNAHCPDGENVIIHEEAAETAKELKKHGYNVIKTDTSEYLKSGGSVYCMKLYLNNKTSLNKPV